QQGVVPPPGMVGREINRSPVKSGRQAVPHAAFILSSGDELPRACLADLFPHRAHPVQKRFLREQEIVIHAKRVVADIHSTRAELEFSRQDRKSTRLNSSHVAISYAVFCLKKKNLPNT